MAAQLHIPAIPNWRPPFPLWHPALIFVVFWLGHNILLWRLRGVWQLCVALAYVAIMAFQLNILLDFVWFVQNGLRSSCCSLYVVASFSQACTHIHKRGLEPLPLRAAFNRIVHQKAPLEMSAPASLNILCTSLPHIPSHACGQCAADCALRAAPCHSKCIHCGLLGVLSIFIKIYTLLHSCFLTHLLWWVISLVHFMIQS